MGSIRDVPVIDIVVPPKRRPVDRERAKSLADSIREIGLLQPIGVNDDLRLIWGAHRLEAYRLLGLKTITCMFLDLAGLSAELAEIDENIQRSELPKVLYLQALARRKEIYEAMHPETKAGVAGGKASTDSRAGNQQPTKMSFVEETAKKTGSTPRTVERDVAIGKNLDTQAASDIATIPKVANSKTELKKLSELPPEKQREVAKEIKAGKTKSVPAKTKAAEKVVDAKKHPVPSDLIPVFETASEFKAIARELTVLLKRAEVLANGPAGAFLEYGQVRTGIENARHAVKFGTPYVVCTYCRGSGVNCKPCRGSGYLNQTTTTRNEESE